MLIVMHPHTSYQRVLVFFSVKRRYTSIVIYFHNIKHVDSPTFGSRGPELEKFIPPHHSPNRFGRLSTAWLLNVEKLLNHPSIILDK